jgi:hypothetical protein
MRPSRLQPAVAVLLVAAAGCGHATLRVDTGTQLEPRRFVQVSEHVRLEDRILVTSSGLRTEGRVSRLSDTGLAIVRSGTEVSLTCKEIERIDKPADRLLEGAAIGGLLAVLPAWNGCQNQGRNIPCVIGAIALYAGLGALIDRGIGDAETVYLAWPGACAAGTVPVETMEGLVFTKLADDAFLIAEGFTYSSKVTLSMPKTLKVVGVKGVVLEFADRAGLNVPLDAVGITWRFEKRGLSLHNNGRRYTAVANGATVEFRTDGVLVRGFRIEKL